jgi:prevent-host-death family protein
MTTATIFEAKTQFSKLVKLVQAGETVTITSGREKTPVAQLMPIEPRKFKRLGACYDPTFELGPEFFEPLPKDWSGEESDQLSV